jgi:uncharacterized protein YbjT (DUF2867 family)
MPPTLVIGASGTVGRQVIAALLASDVPVRALTRNPERPFPPSVDVVAGDLVHPETLEPALNGVERVFLVWTAPAAAVMGAVAMVARHARRIVFLSAPHQTPHPFFQQPNPMRDLHRHIEHTIEASGLEWTFLRPGMFAMNSVGFWAPQIRRGDVVRWPYADARTAPIDLRDVAAVAAHVLLDDSQIRRDHVLTGPQSLTQAEQVGIIGDAIGRRLRFVELTPEDARTELSATMPGAVIDMLMNAWAAAVDRPAWVTDAVNELLGRPARSFADWARDHAQLFQPS